MKKIFSLFVAMSFLISSVFLWGGTKAFATTGEESSLTNEELLNADEQLGAYIYYEDGKPFVDIEKLETDGLAEEYIEIGLMVNQISSSYSNDQANTIKAAKISIPVWGNWCGPGHGSGTPQDLLDRGCQIHDKCYEDKGYFTCSCDWELVIYIETYFHKMGLKEKIAATALKTYFNNTLCNPF
ncbi:phospholipase A2 family protein [Lysinibacillus sp. KU-BSD001]|uniref:phospholipase A2 family protein n=1 Tax=Lysinibacillus sp. KU-BSD001 TaxID=3141328 RepID=UPI0036EF5F77